MRKTILMVAIGMIFSASVAFAEAPALLNNLGDATVLSAVEMDSISGAGPIMEVRYNFTGYSMANIKDWTFISKKLIQTTADSGKATVYLGKKTGFVAEILLDNDYKGKTRHHKYGSMIGNQQGKFSSYYGF